ncbi:GNAT family N-acetyltransferase [Marinifilum flexuosum]|uniref:GNAT family N-acetyltransferase n=1 Tax=Marinifilum flexuosum TaxID=1117708 RepID=UPI00248FD869|nr:GNAT family N-acetyltransferase [Marinifilum flexuosum]
MTFDVVKLNSIKGQEKYQSLLSLYDNIEPYYLIDFIDVFGEGMNNLICYYLDSTNKEPIILVGYLKPTRINDDNKITYDFITPYGYNGPLYSKNITKLEVREFWNYVDQWNKDNNVISEFVRFDLFGNQRYYNGEVYPTMLNVKGKILNEDSQWNSFDRKVRKNVNRAKRENLTCKVNYGIFEDTVIEEFYSIYIDTMKRTNAQDKFFYTIEGFKKFIYNNPSYCAICNIYFSNVCVSSELLLVSKESVYSFLGGTDPNYFDKRPNDYLKYEVINWARSEMKLYYVLGGGYGYEDGIFKYKKCFFPNDVVQYSTGRKIIDKDEYVKLLAQVNKLRVNANKEKLNLDDDSFFPLYNKLD